MYSQRADIRVMSLVKTNNDNDNYKPCAKMRCNFHFKNVSI